MRKKDFFVKQIELTLIEDNWEEGESLKRRLYEYESWRVVFNSFENIVDHIDQSFMIEEDLPKDEKRWHLVFFPETQTYMISTCIYVVEDKKYGRLDKPTSQQIEDFKNGKINLTRLYVEVDFQVIQVTKFEDHELEKFDWGGEL